ncbi:Protein of unknown function [Actinokineospora alba]|uniref:DUF742 domain-containing protein n=1 Tax=Actinokineospora alba TaxID=504798 RepID=A0A1H0LHS9_9PSEU|nr:DUF742 domain-containing protein [Actinokineospora alba]TDP67332.1 uncharacterized protein DUF742 [Actinokineospora alba]SDJ00063.1 Protein of unknown function [Actinokineospora alba]SDO67712.1 Protein of unknown function [Actinokineospora alba]
MAQSTFDGRGKRRRRAEVGRTGARFGPVGAWRDESEPVDPLFVEPDPESPVGLTGARFGGGRAKPKRTEPEPEPPREIEPEPVVELVDAKPIAEEYLDWVHRPESHSLVRPYAWTGGRTRAGTQLAIEAIVQTAGPAPTWESRAITELCTTPRSVAEVAALLSVPLGVARVLIGDLADQGVLVVERVAGNVPDLEILGRVLAGLQNL